MKLALITGASSGIGEALARLLAEKGYSLILTGRNATKLEVIGLATEALETIVADLQYKEGRDKVTQAIRERVPDLVINNAGMGFYGEALTLPIADQLSVLRVNAEVVLELTLEAVQALAKSGKQGIVMNVSSVAGEYPMPGMSVYSASKAFVTNVSQGLNTELSSKGIHVLVSCPGMVSTDFANRAARRQVPQEGGPVMSPSFAAEEIWKQIERKQEKHIFNWQYRLGSLVATQLLPLSWVKKAVWKQIQKRF
jgi:uncharacterized protein